MIRYSIVAVSILFLSVVGVQVYRLSAQRRAFEHELRTLTREAEILAEENQVIEADLTYYANTENLMKEFRSLFNYSAPGEELHIIVPRK